MTITTLPFWIDGKMFSNNSNTKIYPFVLIKNLNMMMVIFYSVITIKFLNEKRKRSDLVDDQRNI